MTPKSFTNSTNVVLIAGGTGGYTCRRALAGREGFLNISHLVGSWDFGGGSRQLLETGQITLPPGDIAQGILAASMFSEFDKQVYRTRDDRKQSLINLHLSAYERETGDFHQAVKEALRFFRCQGQVMAVTLNQTRLSAKTATGQWLEGEDTIDTYEGEIGSPQLQSFHPGPIQVNPEAIRAIEDAHFIIIGPGSFITSLSPNFLVPEIQQAVATSQAILIGVSNLANDAQTPGWTAHDFGQRYGQLAGRPLNYLIANSGRVASWIAEQYQEGKDKGSQSIVELGQAHNAPYQTIEVDFTSSLGQRDASFDGGVKRSLLRHTPQGLQNALLSTFDQNGHNHPW